jgi:hypothetical protein
MALLGIRKRQAIQEVGDETFVFRRLATDAGACREEIAELMGTLTSQTAA